MYEKALKFATAAHEGQFRKNSKEPYISHPVAVSNILREGGYPDDVAVAALLHDTVEDTEVTIEEIAREFGESIAAVVAGVTEDKSLSPWKVRKEAYITKITHPDTPYASLLVAAADKIHNLTDTYETWLAIGDKVFERFNAQKESQSWWYRSMSKVFENNGLGEVSKSINLMLDEMGL